MPGVCLLGAFLNHNGQVYHVEINMGLVDVIWKLQKNLKFSNVSKTRSWLCHTVALPFT
jgi:hypothetical protein